MRTALPPLHDKEVELVSITRVDLMWSDSWLVRLIIDGLPYLILKQKCRDELGVLVWLAKLQHKQGAN